jgi:DNA polymerase-1
LILVVVAVYRAAWNLIHTHHAPNTNHQTEETKKEKVFHTVTTRRIVFDIETNGLLPTVSRVHCVSVRDLDTGALEYSLSPLDTEADWREVMAFISSADLVVGHNIINLDIPVLKKLGWITELSGQVLDTMLLARLLFPDVKKQLDFDKHRSLVRRHGTKEASEAKQYARIMGKHSLEAWGVRLGVHKGSYGNSKDEDTWKEWTPEMQVYMDQDTEVSVALWRYLGGEALKWYGAKWMDALSVRIVHRTAEVCQRIEENGWPFNEAAATKLYAELSQQREDLSKELVEAFGSWAEPGETKTPGRNDPKYHRTKDCPYTPVRFVTFNPRSLDHIAKRLQDKYQWEPEEFTPSGKPKLDEGVLGHLEDVYPEVSLLSRFLMVQKRIAALVEGKQAWMQYLRNGRIHASYMVNGTVSGRASHHSPNIAQVPAADVPYGPECRDLFTVPPGWTALGADASGLELRCLSHYLAAFDGGSYAAMVSQGDVHTGNQKAAGLPTRNAAKTFI